MIDQDFIKNYLKAKFPEGTYQSNGTELTAPSLFIDADWKKHMSINTETGLWQDFKSGKKGNFIHLYSWIEKMPYAKAEYRLQLLNLFLDRKIEQVKEIQLDKEKLSIDDFHLVIPRMDGWKPRSEFHKEVICYALDRKIHNYLDLMFCEIEGSPYYKRLIIPFHNHRGEIYYFQARAITNGQQPKYLFPESSKSAIKAGNILFPYNPNSQHLVVCEGAIDAISLQMMGINATAVNGAHISDTQAEMLASFRGELILGFDNDMAGKRGVEDFDRLRKKKNMPAFSILRLPQGCKDWNEALTNPNINLTSEYVYSSNKVKYDFFYHIDECISQR